MQWHLRVSMKPSANILFRIFARIHCMYINLLKRNYKEIPIIINNFNRLEYLIKMLEWLEKAGYRNIYIIDNYSTYPPLLDYYKKTNHIVFRLDKNVGHLALWKTHIYLYFKNTYYVYTDPDILPVEECPDDVLNYFIKILDKYPEIDKVGFGLKTDDLPDHYANKLKVIKWENQYWAKKIEADLYIAPIDTTFALYRPNTKGDWQLKAIRTAGKYLARHLPWYINSSKIAEEEKFFQENTTSASSWYNKEKYN